MQARKGPDSQVVVIGGHVMVAQRLLDDPRVAEIDGFVTDEEAAYLIDLANKTGLKKSHVVCKSSKYSSVHYIIGRRGVGYMLIMPVARRVSRSICVTVNIKPCDKHAVWVLWGGAFCTFPGLRATGEELVESGVVK